MQAASASEYRPACQWKIEYNRPEKVAGQIFRLLFGNEADPISSYGIAKFQNLSQLESVFELGHVEPESRQSPAPVLAIVLRTIYSEIQGAFRTKAAGEI